jgi:WD40 repeat protein/serine/threonine protein kinase
LEPDGAAVRPFGDYEILELVARGGMGAVYRARQKSLNRVVALKLIAAGEFASRDSIRRFRSEAEAAARLDHPNIVPIFEIGEHEDQQYFSMKFIDGGCLEEKLPLSQAKAVSMLVSMARAVHHAHQHGILHRDLKPANILLDRQGGAHLTDFGLSRLIEQENDLTRTRGVLGTPAYVAPEQASGGRHSLTTAVDVYGLGAVFYHALTGQPPFAGGTTLQTLRQVLEQEPRRPSFWKPGMDPDLETICLKCLEKEPQRRYLSADALANDLERWRRHEPITARPCSGWEKTWKWVRRHPTGSALVATALVALVTIAIGTTVMSLRVSAANQRAEARSEEFRRSIVQLNVSSGARFVEQGDLLTGLLWFSQALQLERGHPNLEERHHFRLGAALRQAPVLKQIWFHQGPVNYAEYSPDGRLVVTASYDGTAQIWDSRSGQAVGSPLRHGSNVTAAVFSPAGTLVATFSEDGTARVWDAATGQPTSPPLHHETTGERYPLAPGLGFSSDEQWLVTAGPIGARLWKLGPNEPAGPLLPHLAPVNHAAFSPDGKMVVTASDDKTAALWNRPDEITKVVRVQSWRHPAAVKGAWFSPDSHRIATICDDWTASVWDVETGQRLFHPIKGTAPMFQAIFSPDGRWLLTASFDNTARVWDAATGEPISPPLKHGAGLSMARFSPNGRQVLGATYGNVAQLWDAITGERVGYQLHHGGFVLAATFSPDGKRVLTASQDHTARLWQLTTDGGARLSVHHERPVIDAALGPGDRPRLLTGSHDRTAQIWDSSTGRPLGLPIRLTDAVRNVALSSDGTKALACGDRTARVWKVGVPGEPERVLRHQGIVWRAAFSPDGSKVVTASDDFTAQIWDADTAAPIAPPLRHEQVVESAEFSPDGNLVATASRDRSARIWNARTGSPVSPPLMHECRVYRARFSPDGSRLVTCCLDATYFPRYAQLWDVRSFGPITPRLYHLDGVLDTCFSPDGKLVATGGEDNAARVWDAQSGRPVTGWLRHQNQVISVAFSPDSRRLVTASLDGTACVWDAATGEPLSPPLRHSAQVMQAAFSGDGRSIVTASWDGTARIWDLTQSELPANDVSEIAQLLSAQRLETQSGPLPLDAVTVSNLWNSVRKRHPELFSAPR